MVLTDDTVCRWLFRLRQHQVYGHELKKNLIREIHTINIWRIEQQNVLTTIIIFHVGRKKRIVIDSMYGGIG
jgi:hypothetical protein